MDTILRILLGESHNGIRVLADLYMCVKIYQHPLGHKVPKNYAFMENEVALFPVKYQILLLASLQDFV